MLEKIHNFEVVQCGPQLTDDPKSEAALPEVSLTFLEQFCEAYAIDRAFEFGSGRSTYCLLSLGCSVTSLEDSDHWSADTKSQLKPEHLCRFTGIVSRLRTCRLGYFPVLNWRLDGSLRNAIADSDLILVDSPHFTPFRELTPLRSLNNLKKGFVIVDDLRISTVRRFCERIARQNDNLEYVLVPIGHELANYYKKAFFSVKSKPSIADILKGWRRFFIGLQFYRNLRAK